MSGGPLKHVMPDDLFMLFFMPLCVGIIIGAFSAGIYSYYEFTMYCVMK